MNGEMDFSLALQAIKNGKRVRRYFWNGKGMFIFLVKGSKFKVNRQPLLEAFEEGTEVEYQDHIDMKTSHNSIVPWIASQTDMLAEDWVLVD